MILYDLFYVEMVAISNSNPVVMQCQISPPPPNLSRVHTRHIGYMCIRPCCYFSFLCEIQISRKGDNFEKTGQQREVHIKFYCNPKKPFGEPAFTGQEGNKYFFDFQTSLVCSPRAVQCAVSSSDGKSYDLTPLGLTDGKLK